MFRDLYKAGSISAIAFDDVHFKVRKARVACGYDPMMAEASDDEGDRGVD